MKQGQVYPGEKNEESLEDASILVLGIGNTLLSDEGAGVEAVWRLDREHVFPPNVELLDGGTSGMALLNHIENRDCLFLLDAVESREGKPGSVVRIDLGENPGYFQSKISPHQLGISEVLAAATLLSTHPRRTILYGVHPQSLESGTELTPVVREGVGEMLQSLVRELKALGLHIEPAVGPRSN